MKAKADFDSGKITKTEIDQVKRESNNLVRFLVEYVQRKRSHEFERSRLRIVHGQKQAEITVIGNTAYIIRDIASPESTLEKAPIQADGSIGATVQCTMQDFDQALAQGKPTRIRMREQLFASLASLFGRDYELAQ